MTRCIAQRIWAKVEVDESGCWIFTGAKTNGYGFVAAADRRMAYPHRVMYEVLVGPIPEGLDIDHLCRVRACCNPHHLEPVTRQVNLLRGETLTAAHKAGRDCGFERCCGCRRFRRADLDEVLTPVEPVAPTGEDAA